MSGQHATRQAASPLPAVSDVVAVPAFIAPENRDDFLAGWAAGRDAATAGPLPDEIACEVVLILDATDASRRTTTTPGGVIDAG